MVEINRLSGLSMDIEASNRDKLRSVFPQCFNDGKLDIDKLLNLCGEYIEPGQEKYKFDWNGKTESYKLAGKRSTGTLRPCREDSVNFDTTKNIYIEGDNLEVLKLLQTAYFRQVKMIYIDPPYNTGNDFVYEDDFKDPIEKYKEVTNQTTKSNPETMGRFHTNWLNMMYPRLTVAASLLRDDGVIFISIDDNEVTNLRKLCDEVFGEENFQGHIHWRRRHNQPNDKTKMIGLVAEHIIAYSKNSEVLKKAGVGKIDLTGTFTNPDNDPRGGWASKPWKVGSDQSGSRYIITTPTGKVLDEEWMGDENTFKELLADNRIIFPRGGDGMPRKKYFKYEREQEGQCATNWWECSQFGHNQGANDCMTELFGIKNVFSNPKPIELLRALLQIGNVKSNDIVLDFFSGSATTAHAVMQLNAEDGGNRQFICVQLPEQCDEKSEAFKAGYKNICEIGKERIRCAGKKILANHETRHCEQSEAIQKNLLDSHEAKASRYDKLDIGFRVFKLDSSNLVKWDATPTNDEEELKLRFLGMKDSLVVGRTPEDFVFEVMLKLGVPLDFPVKPIKINDKEAFSIGENCLVLVCTDRGQNGITPEDIEAMCEYSPAKIVTSEDAFTDDTALSNAHYILKDRDIEMKLL